VAAGSYTITAKAFDNLGASTTYQRSRTVTVCVRRQPTSPASRWSTQPRAALSPRSASITVSVNATDPDGTIARVDFSLGSLQGSDTTSPYSFTFTNVPAGTYAIERAGHRQRRWGRRPRTR
jgi:chitinase